MKLKKLIFPAAAAAAAVVCAVAPGRIPRGVSREAFQGRNLAHRGLHGQDCAAPENSPAAFRAAAEAGYGAELDVRLTADGQVVVFHDDSLLRLCGVDLRVEELTLSRLRQFRLSGTQEGIPLLSEALTALGGAPVVVELKRGGANVELCEKTLKLIDGYGGATCVESFDPFIVRWFRKNAPDILRGQLSSPPAELAEGTNPLSAFLVGNLLTNFLCRPHFIAYKIGKKPPTVRLCEAMGAMRVAWTSHSAENERANDAVIFEGYRPDVSF